MLMNDNQKERIIDFGQQLILQRIVDQFDAEYFVQAETTVDLFLRQGVTVSGYPHTRPNDCAAVTAVLRQLLERNRVFIRYGDVSIKERFFSLVWKYRDSPLHEYPSELHKLDVLIADAYCACGEYERAVELLEPLVARPFLIQEAEVIWQVATLLARANPLSRGGPKAVRGAPTLVKMLIALRPWSAMNMFNHLAPSWRSTFETEIHTSTIERAISFLMHVRASLSQQRASLLNRSAFAFARIFTSIIGTCLLFINSTKLVPSLKKNRREPFVTRAMGGIGDLLMMTPGLRALSIRRGHPIKFATKKVFHPIFENNPYVELIDIEEITFSLEEFRWINLSICPAGRYEAMSRPTVKKGRVELFARAMGVSERSLERTGRKVDISLTPELTNFATVWLERAGFSGQRRIIGVQPHSRDSYKDYPRMSECVKLLSDDYDIVIFHHKSLVGYQGPGIVSTAGLTLSQSFAILSRVELLLCVDSSLLHAASAFETPVVTLFGPLDGKLATFHIKNARHLDAKSTFGCSPCWRNEDRECLVTGQLGVSPCMNAIAVSRVVDAVRRRLALK